MDTWTIAHVVWGLTCLSMIVCGASSLCPAECICEKDSLGRSKVLCQDGDLSPNLPVLHMDPKTQVIMVTAPDAHSANYLTIGPIFQQFSRLEEVHISHSNIPAIGRHSFWGVPTLRLLNLTYNNISSVLDYNFRGMSDLEELHLDSNRIGKMSSGTFRYLTGLKVLSLKDNLISELVPRLFHMLGGLKELDLSGNPLQELLPDAFKDVQELRTLRCRGCDLRSINTQLYHLLPQLRELDLGENSIHYLPPDEFAPLRKLKYLFLDGNRLGVLLPGLFKHQSQLSVLQLASNRLVKIAPGAFEGLESIQELDLSGNQLMLLEQTVMESVIPTIQKLDVGGNHVNLEELRPLLQNMKQLMNIGLRSLKIADLPLGLFEDNIKLMRIDLSRNELQAVPIQILTPLTKLQELDLRKNQLKGIEERLSQRFSYINRVLLADNPWQCDMCHVRSLIGTHKWDNPTCASPAALKGQLLASLDPSDLGWCTLGVGGRDAASTELIVRDGPFGAYVAIGIPIFLIGLALLITSLCYVRKHSARYYTGEEKHTDHSVVSSQLCTSTTEVSFRFPAEERLAALADVS